MYIGSPTEDIPRQGSTEVQGVILRPQYHKNLREAAVSRSNITTVVLYCLMIAEESELLRHEISKPCFVFAEGYDPPSYRL